MTKTKGRKVILFIVAAFIGGFIVLSFLFVGPPKLLAKSDKPRFCVSCHVMESSYEAWIHAGAHRRNLCVDCHLPNYNRGSHYIWKIIDGMKDAFVFYSGTVPERITISSHGEKTLQENCIRCHEVIVTMIYKERKCWECHKRINHKLTGTIEIL
jgi:cytochrome c nitrite reductase small subunit